jgi:hypothetical protein
MSTLARVRARSLLHVQEVDQVRKHEGLLHRRPRDAVDHSGGDGAGSAVASRLRKTSRNGRQGRRRRHVQCGSSRGQRPRSSLSGQGERWPPPPPPRAAAQPRVATPAHTATNRAQAAVQAPIAACTHGAATNGSAARECKHGATRETHTRGTTAARLATEARRGSGPPLKHERARATREARTRGTTAARPASEVHRAAAHPREGEHEGTREARLRGVPPRHAGAAANLHKREH